ASKHRGDPVNLVSLRDICVSKCRGSPAGGAFVPGLLLPYGLAMTFSFLSLRGVCVSKRRGSPDDFTVVLGIASAFGLAMTSHSPRDCFAQPLKGLDSQ
ncbi:hypothetical protein D6821_00005, partial [Candidatus Parcubacteria bacterium]